MLEIREYQDRFGRSLYERWLSALDAVTQARVFIALQRSGGRKCLKPESVGGGVHEIRLQFGPGYRIYCGLDGETLVILLGGGTKKRQNLDIERAKASWRDYKKIKSEELSGR